MKSVCPISQPESAIKLTLIIPTLNEVDNIEPLILGLERVLRDIAWTVIFVDDNSGDGTFDVIRTLASDRPRIQAIRRIGKRGLSTACIEGMAMAVSPYLAVLDADLQHDEHLLRPRMSGSILSTSFNVGIPHCRTNASGEYSHEIGLSNFST